MYSFPDSYEKLKKRISSYKSSFNKEKKIHGYIRDGRGKRYVLFWLYFALNDLNKSYEYIKWYEKKFPDDLGEPVQKLCWAITLYRLNNLDKAKFMLADLMFSNLYLIPYIIGHDVQEYDIWHCSNYEEIEYLDYIPEKIMECLKRNEIDWIEKTYNSNEFGDIRNRFIEIHHKLLSTHEYEKRKKLNKESDLLLENLKKRYSNIKVLK